MLGEQESFYLGRGGITGGFLGSEGREGDGPTPVHTRAALAGLSGLSEEEKGWMGRRMRSGDKMGVGGWK